MPNSLEHRTTTSQQEVDDYYSSLPNSCRAWDENLDYCGKPPVVIATGKKPAPDGHIIRCGFCRQHIEELQADTKYAGQWTYKDVK